MPQSRVDVYRCCGAREQLEALQADIEGCVKAKEYVVHDPEQDDEYELLQRKKHAKREGTWLCANPEHIDEVRYIWDIEMCKAAPHSSSQEQEGQRGGLALI